MKVSLTPSYLAYSNASNIKQHTKNLQTNFKGSEDDEKTVTYTLSEINRLEKDNFGKGVLSGAAIILGVAGTWGLATIADSQGKRETQEKALENIMNILQDENIKKDSFTVKDINNDESPEIIFEKQDGTKMAFDVKNNKLLEEKTTFQE